MVRTLRYAVLCSLFVGAVKADVAQVAGSEWKASLDTAKDAAKVSLAKIEEVVKGAYGEVVRRFANGVKNQDSTTVDGAHFGKKSVDRQSPDSRKLQQEKKPKLFALNRNPYFRPSGNRYFDREESTKVQNLNSSPDSSKTPAVTEAAARKETDKQDKDLNNSAVQPNIEGKSMFSNVGVYCTAAATQATTVVAAHPYMAVGGAVAVAAVVWAGYKLKQLACAPVRVKTMQQELKELEGLEELEATL